MKKNSGTLKFILIGLIVALLVSTGLFFTIPKTKIIESKTIAVEEGDYSRTLYGVPRLDLEHYSLDEDRYFKYLVEGVVNVGRPDPTSNPRWYQDRIDMIEEEKRASELQEKLRELGVSLGDSERDDSSVEQGNGNKEINEYVNKINSLLDSLESSYGTYAESSDEIKWTDFIRSFRNEVRDVKSDLAENRVDVIAVLDENDYNKLEGIVDNLENLLNEYTALVAGSPDSEEKVKEYKEVVVSDMKDLERILKNLE